MSAETESEIVKAVPVILPIGHWAQLKRESRETGRSASAIIRELVAVHLLTRNHPIARGRKKEINK